MSKTDACVKANKEKALKRQNEIMKLIDEMEQNGQKVSFYSVQQESGASRSYLYKNPVLSERIYFLRDNQPARNEKSKDVIINSLRLQNKKLQSKIKEFERENSETYKQQLEKALQENKELKQQLTVAYEYKLKEN